MQNADATCKRLSRCHATPTHRPQLTLRAALLFRPKAQTPEPALTRALLCTRFLIACASASALLLPKCHSNFCFYQVRQLALVSNSSCSDKCLIYMQFTYFFKKRDVYATCRTLTLCNPPVFTFLLLLFALCENKLRQSLNQYKQRVAEGWSGLQSAVTVAQGFHSLLQLTIRLDLSHTGYELWPLDCC